MKKKSTKIKVKKSKKSIEDKLKTKKELKQKSHDVIIKTQKTKKLIKKTTTAVAAKVSATASLRPISLTIDEKILKKVDKKAKASNMNRSNFLRQAIIKSI